MNDFYILTHGENCIPYSKFEKLAEGVKEHYHHSSPRFWMWKMFQFGFAYGKHAARQRKARAAA